MWNAVFLHRQTERLICPSVHVYVCVRIQMGSSGLLQTLSDSGLTRALAFGSCICVGVEQPKHTNTPINESINVCKMYIYLHSSVCSRLEFIHVAPFKNRFIALYNKNRHWHIENTKESKQIKNHETQTNKITRRRKWTKAQTKQNQL